MGGSLALKPKYRPTFYGLILLATVVGIGINLVGVDVIKALYAAAVINGVVAVPLLVLISLLGSDARTMGQRVSGPISRCLTWAATLLMAAAAVTMIAASLLGGRH
jgi:Mn2+/Fe2+ NRAMP family transporter